MQNKREPCISRIIKTLKCLKLEKLEYDRKAFLHEIMSEFQVCEKTAIEYLDAGLARYEKVKNEILKEADAVLT